MSLTEGGLLRVFQTIIDNLPSGVSLLDKNLRFVAWNSEIKQLLSFPDELFNPDDPPEMAKVALFNARRGEPDRATKIRAPRSASAVLRSSTS